jgi:hypothetical protein
MTPAERQRRRRKRLRKEQLKLGRKAERERRRLKEAKRYIPMPPGLTYWVKVRVGDREILQPTTVPLPSAHWHEFRDEDLRYLMERARRELERRGAPAEATSREPGGAVVETDTVTVGPS